MTEALAGLFAATLIVAMAWDVARLEIPDAASLVLLAGFAVGAAASGTAWDVVASHVAAGLAVFAAGAALFYLGVWGGGDAKLAGAMALWLGWGGLAPWLLVVALAGGAVSLAILALRRSPAPASAGISGPPWLRRLRDPSEGVPYGLALGIGGLTLIDAATAFAAG